MFWIVFTYINMFSEDFNRIIRAMPVWVMLDNIPDENTGNESNSENNEESE